MSPERQHLAEQQAALLHALSTPHETVPGFDARMLRLTARSLVGKRVRAAGRVWPRLQQALGERFDELFADYALEQPLPPDAVPLSDGRAFVDWLQQRETLPDAALLEVLAVDLRYQRVREGLVPRWWPTLQWRRLPQARRVVFALRVPGLGEWWLG